MSVLPAQAWQYIAWGLGLIEVIVGLYILALNIWNNANRHVGVWLLFTSVSTIATGFLFSAESTAQMLTAFTIQVMVAPVAQVGLLIITAVLLAPQLMQGRRRWWWVPVYIIAFLPMLLTIVDTQFGTNLWFTPVPEGGVIGIQLAASDFERGWIAVPLRILNSALPTIGIVLALLIALRKDTPAMTRRLAWLLFAGLVIVTGSQFGLEKRTDAQWRQPANQLCLCDFVHLYWIPANGFRATATARSIAASFDLASSGGSHTPDCG